MIKNQIIRACNKNPEEEVCGFVVFKDDEFGILECENKAQNKKDEFYIPAKDYLYVKNNYEIIAVYHSHLESDENPSEFDKKMSDLTCLPFVMYSHQTRKFNVFKPEFLDCDQSKLSKLEDYL